SLVSAAHLRHRAPALSPPARSRARAGRPAAFPLGGAAGHPWRSTSSADVAIVSRDEPEATVDSPVGTGLRSRLSAPPPATLPTNVPAVVSQRTTLRSRASHSCTATSPTGHSLVYPSTPARGT